METIWLKICAFALSLLMAIAPAGPGPTEAELRITEGNIAALIEAGTPVAVENVDYAHKNDVVYIPVGSDQMLVSERVHDLASFYPYLYSLETWERRELVADENDKDTWMQLLEQMWQGLNPSVQARMEAMGLDAADTAQDCCNAIFTKHGLLGDRYYASGNRLLVENARAGYFVVDTDTAIVRPFTNAQGFAPDGRVICWELLSNEYTLVDADMNAESFSLNVPEEWHVTDLYPAQAGTVMLLRQARVNMESMEYAIGWADAQGEVTKIVSLGMYGGLAGPDTLVYLPESRAAVAWSQMRVLHQNPTIVREGAEEACVLRSNGSALEEVPLGEFLAAGGDINVLENPLIFIGVSRDGSCAMVLDYAVPSLILVDFATMNRSVLLSGEEAFEAMGTDPANVSMMCWDGGEYLYSRLDVMRLVPAA